MGHEVTVEFLLEGDHPRFKMIQAVVIPGELVGIFKAGCRAEFAGDIELHVDIYAVLLQLMDQVVELVELNRLDKGIRTAVLALRRICVVDIVHAHAVDAKTRQRCRDGVRIGLTFRKATGKADVGAQEAPALAAAVHKMDTLGRQKAVAAGRLPRAAGPGLDVADVVRQAQLDLEGEFWRVIATGFNLRQELGILRRFVGLSESDSAAKQRHGGRHDQFHRHVVVPFSHGRWVIA